MKTIEGKILEIRTTSDGDYDWSCNCWESEAVLIVTDKGKFAFVGVDDEEKDENWMKPIDVADDYRKTYPFVLHRYSSSELSVYAEEYDTEGNLTDVELNYEDVILWIAANSVGYMLCSVHSNTEKYVVEDECEKSRFLPRDELDEYIRIEFDKEQLQGPVE